MRLGDRIKLIRMNDDPDPIPDGATGTITHVGPDFAGTRSYSVKWDYPYERRSLSVCIPPDVCEVLEP